MLNFISIISHAIADGLKGPPELQFLPSTARFPSRKMSTAVPEIQLTVVSNKTSSKLQTLPVPNPGPGEVLIRNVTVASNPKDWKVFHYFPEHEAVEGNDVAGHIVRVGEGVKEYKGGERVAAFSKMGTGENKVCGKSVTTIRLMTESS